MFLLADHELGAQMAREGKGPKRHGRFESDDFSRPRVREPGWPGLQVSRGMLLIASITESPDGRSPLRSLARSARPNTSSATNDDDTRPSSTRRNRSCEASQVTTTKVSAPAIP